MPCFIYRIFYTVCTGLCGVCRGVHGGIKLYQGHVDGRPIYLVSSSSTGVVIPSICSPLSDLEKTVLEKYITVGSMSHTSCMSHFMYR